MSTMNHNQRRRSSVIVPSSSTSSSSTLRGDLQVVSSILSASDSDFSSWEEHVTIENRRVVQLGLGGCCSLSQQIPKSIGKLQALTVLDLSGLEMIRNLPSDISNLTNLEYINLNGCKNLQVLLSSDELMGDGGSLHALRRLKKLTMRDCCSLRSIPSHVAQLENLEELDVSGCFSIWNLPNDIKALKKLKCLILSKCKNLRSLTASVLKELKNLERLDLEDCTSLTCLPAELGQLISLQELNIGNCTNLRFVPSQLGNLRQLKMFRATKCRQLTSLPASFQHLNHLRTVDVSYCLQLQEIPSEIFGLERLEELNVSFCTGLTVLPVDWTRLTKLKSMNVGGLTLDVISWINNPKASSSTIETIYLHCSQLERKDLDLLWRAIQKFPSLSHVYLGYNRISELHMAELLSWESSSCDNIGDSSSNEQRVSPTQNHLPRLRTLELSDNPIMWTINQEQEQEALARLLNRHMGLGYVAYRFEVSTLYTPEIEHLLDVNESGRDLLFRQRQGKETLLGVWPVVMARVNNLFRETPARNANALYYLLREGVGVAAANLRLSSKSDSYYRFPALPTASSPMSKPRVEEIDDGDLSLESYF